MKTPASKRIGSMPVALLTAFLLAAFSAGAGESDNDNAPFEAKVKELTAGKTTRLEKIMALHVFVRDSIRQVETRFG